MTWCVTKTYPQNLSTTLLIVLYGPLLSHFLRHFSFSGCYHVESRDPSSSYPAQSVVVVAHDLAVIPIPWPAVTHPFETRRCRARVLRWSNHAKLLSKEDGLRG